LADDPDESLTIGAFARRSRLSLKALRLYERRGLLMPAGVDETTGYRRYRAGQLSTARLIAMLRRLDMPLAEVAAVIAAPEPLSGELVATYWDSIEQRVAVQRELARHLQIRLAGAEGSYEMFEVQQREVPEQLLLTEQRHIRVPELSDWMGSAFGRLEASAERFGGPAGPALAIFHGEVNDDSDGPVEVCVPIDRSRDPGTDVPARIEPAHREAFVRINKAMVEYPQILTAYDAVERWVTSNGIAMTGAPREVYFTDFMAAGPNDEVCDIAFPIA
jgi:DNA-binding transcriptional MerR regulator